MLQWARLSFGFGEWACEPIFQTLSPVMMGFSGKTLHDSKFCFALDFSVTNKGIRFHLLTMLHRQKITIQTDKSLPLHGEDINLNLE